jgi:hypothetical protein
MPPAPPAYGPPGASAKRPGTVLAAMVLWIIVGVVSLVVAAALLAAAGNESFHRRVVAQIGTEIASSALLGVGVLAVLIGIAYIVLAVLMSRARNWARIAISVLGVLGLILLFGLNILMFVLVAVAIMLQFLPASNNYFTAAKQVR